VTITVPDSTGAPSGPAGTTAPPPAGSAVPPAPSLSPEATVTATPTAEGLARRVARTALVVIAVSMLALVLQLTVISRLEQRAAQTRDFNRLRTELAAQTAPCPGCAGDADLPIAIGTPVAILEIPSIDVNEVVVEGTTSQALTAGPGHLRDTVYPGQAGTSVIFGRRAAYGAPFARLRDLRPGASVTVTTAYGTATYKVTDERTAGSIETPAPETGAGRLTLVTATGSPFVPDGVLYVDADLVGRATAAPEALPRSVPANQRALAVDTNTAWALVLCLLALLAISVGSVWAWRHWGRAQTWIVFVPTATLVGYYTADQITRLLPNLL